MFAEFFTLLFLLVAAHFLCDFPLQGNYLAMAKNRHVLEEIEGAIDARYKIKPKWKEWPWALGGHATIHGAAVYIITGIWFLAFIEIVIHALIDDAKCAGRISYNQDQAFHLFAKVIYAGIVPLSFLSDKF